jgi:hypothetical protein
MVLIFYYVFCVDLRTNSNFALLNIKTLVFITDVECLQRGTH